MNHTPEPRNIVSPKPGERKQTCQLCLIGVAISQEICTCTEVCGDRCRWMPEDEFVMPPVPKFRNNREGLQPHENRSPEHEQDRPLGAW